MGKIDLTRFDFHVYRFMNSDAVSNMTAEEVGQYILLLCQAWMRGKETNLPDDINYLNKIARSKITPLVLSKFPVVNGQRRNPALYQEWLDSIERSEFGRNLAAQRWKEKRNSDASRNAERNAQSYQSTQTNHINNINQTENKYDFEELIKHDRAETDKWREELEKKLAEDREFAKAHENDIF